MDGGDRSELASLLLAIVAGAAYTFALHVLTVTMAPAPNHWWLDQWSIPLALGASTCAFLIASVSRWAFFLVVNISLFLVALAGYFIGAQDVILNKDIIAAILETSAPEAGEFLSIGLLLTLLGTIVLSLIVTIPYLFCYRRNYFGVYTRLAFAALIFMIIDLTVPQPFTASADVFLPASFGVSAYNYYLTREELEEQVRNRFDIATLPSSIEKNTSDNLTLVVVIGKSARADHFSLNGYYRDTNAYTENEAGLVNFRDVISCDVVTRISVPCLLTRATLENKDLMARETSLLNLAKKHGFHTTWISMNDIYGMNNLPISVIANSADEKIFRFGMDSYWDANDLYLLPYFHNAVQKDKNGRQLIVVHLRGSHNVYAKRYPTSFARFKPDYCEEKNCLVDAYDNSILFTDYMLSRFIEDLRDREAILFYVSDHGKSLGETDEHGQVYWRHGQLGRIEQRRIPMQVWASNPFITKFPERFAALKSRATTPISHDHFFHSTLGCLGIHSEAVDEHLSLCTQGSFSKRKEIPVDNSEQVKISTGND